VPDAFQPGGRTPAPAPLDLVQDFVNTEVPDWDRDDIATPAALEGWLSERGLLDVPAMVDEDTLALAHALRSTLRELALANTLGVPLAQSRQTEVDATLARFPLGARLVDGEPGLLPGEGPARGLGTLVAIVVEARLRGDWARMKACRQETCGWLFYDGSRNRSSSWCSMQICGGREKARAYRRRTAARH
jgi:predicted RNA-binding Zn ribbon-like protein